MMIDDTGHHDRAGRITALDYPTENVVPMASNLDELSLIRVGIAPSQAKSSAAAFRAWLKDGGTIQVATSLDQPLPLFKPSSGLIPVPAFDSTASFIAATKLRMTN